MKRAGWLLFLAGSISWASFASALCTGTLEQVISSGICNFDDYSIQVNSFSNIYSTIADPLTASDILLTASAVPGNIGVSINLSVVNNGQFTASTAPPGNFINAEYQIGYTITGPSFFQDETLTVDGGSVNPPISGYWADAYTSQQGLGVFGFGDQSQSLSGLYSKTLDISETLMLNAFTAQNNIAGAAQFSTVTDQFTTGAVDVPEPIAFLLCGSGLLAFGAVRYRRRR